MSAKLYGILNILAQESTSFGRSSVALCIPHLSEKLGDMKLKKPAGETLLLFAEKTSLQFVLGHGMFWFQIPVMNLLANHLMNERQRTIRWESRKRLKSSQMP